MIPVIAEVPDGANAAISAAREEYGTAAISVEAMIPVFGMAAIGVKILNNTSKEFLYLADDVAKKCGKTLKQPSLW